MKVHLKTINKSNWQECITLKIHKEQERYLPSNAYSIAESKFIDNMDMFSIYKDDLMIGFASYVLDEDGDELEHTYMHYTLLTT